MSAMANYPLGADRTIHNWLSSGLITTPIDDLAAVIPQEGSPFGDGKRWILSFWAYHPQSIKLKMNIYRNLPPSSWLPGERPVLNGPAMHGASWQYATAEEDQVIDFSHFNFTPTLMQGWVYTGLYVDKPMTVEAELLTIGPARVWLNGSQILHFNRTFSYVANMHIPVRLNLQEGMNDLYLHGEMFGWREARLAVGLRFKEDYPIKVSVPLGDIDPEAWHRAENGLNNVLVKQFAFPQLPGKLQFSEEAEETFSFEAEVSHPMTGSPWARFGAMQTPTGSATYTLKPGEEADLPITEAVARTMAELPGENALLLRLHPTDGTPLEIKRHIWASTERFSTHPYGDYDSRQREALEHLARMPFDVNAAMAAVELGHAEQIDSAAVDVACSFMENRYDCADFYAVSLMILMHRYADALLPEDQERIERAFTAFKFWIDEPGLDAMCYFTENHQILFHVTAYLAGQLWPERIFSNSGKTGQQQRDRARPRIEAWIKRRLQGGYSEWDSNAYMTLDAFAMLALVECADSYRLREMAETLLHKTFFMIACQSYRGVHGSTHGRCYVTGLKSARMENTSSLQRIAWGMGIFNGETRATGALALAKRYRVPEVIQAIGADVDATLTTLARSKAQYRPQFDLQSGEWDVSTLTHRTPDVMLAAALDHRPGERGVQEHLWQATLGPEAVVFTTYPGNSQEHGEARPNFWSGSARLPRVGMHKQSVICLYRIEENVGLPFTHAYFPTAFFDEWRIESGWAFARSGDGYVALWGDGDLILTQTGKHAGQELRSSGRGEAWLCHVGRRALDGDFDAFCAAVKSHTPEAEGSNLRWTTPDGTALSFDWESDFTVDGAAITWDDVAHYANTYTQTPLDAKTLTISHQGQSITLDLAQGKTLAALPT